MKRGPEESLRRLIAARAARGRRRCVRATGVGVVEMDLEPVGDGNAVAFVPISNNELIRRHIIGPILTKVPMPEIIRLAERLA